MGGIRFRGCWCGCYLEDPFVCFGVKPTKRACAQDFPRERNKTREVKVAGQTWAVDRSEQNKAVGRTGQSVGESNQQESREAECWDLWARGRVGQRERMSQRSLWLCEYFAHIHALDSLQMYRKLCKGVTNFCFLALGANPSPCVFVLFSSTFSLVYVVFCVSVKKCKRRDERNH